MTEWNLWWFSDNDKVIMDCAMKAFRQIPHNIVYYYYYHYLNHFLYSLLIFSFALSPSPSPFLFTLLLSLHSFHSTFVLIWLTWLRSLCSPSSIRDTRNSCASCWRNLVRSPLNIGSLSHTALWRSVGYMYWYLPSQSADIILANSSAIQPSHFALQYNYHISL